MSTMNTSSRGPASGGRHGRHGKRGCQAAAEGLEARRLLSADLVGSFTGTLPASLLPGGTSNTATVTVTNRGDAPAVGTVSVDLYASTDQSLGAGDTLLKSLSRKINLKPNGSTAYKFKYASPVGLPDGSYSLLANVDSTNAVTESEETNNLAVSPTAVTISKAFVDLSASLAGVPTAVSLGGKHAKPPALTVLVTNQGNIPAKGAVGINLYASTNGRVDSSAIGPLTVPAKPINLKPGKSKAFKIKVVLPSNTPNDSFYVIAVLAPTGLTDANTSNNTAVSPSKVTVTNPNGPTGPALNSTLATSQNRVAVGPGDPVTFTATVARPQSGDTVQVHELDASGNDLGEIATLYDDGSPLHNDATAGDGVFNNTVVINFGSPGQRSFQAVLSDPAGTQQTSVATVAGMAPPSQAAVEAATADNTSLTRQAQAGMAAGQGGAQVLQGLTAHLQAEPDKVVPGSIQSTATSVSWETPDGITSAVTLNDLNGQVPSPTPSATAADQTPGSGTTPSSCGCDAGTTPGATGATRATTGATTGAAAGTPPTASAADALPTDQPNTCKQAIILYSDVVNINPIQGALQSAGGGYKVTTRVAEVEDFKNLGSYGSISLLARGDVINGIGPVIGAAQAGSYVSSYLPDLVSKRLVLLNGEYAITPSFVRAYAGALNHAIVYAQSDNSLADSRMGDAFLSQGAADYVGYAGTLSRSTDPNNAASRLYNTLTTVPPSPDMPNNRVIDTPGLFEADANGDTLKDDGDSNAILPSTGCTTISQYDLVLQYTWPDTQKDLDTGTSFLGSTAGYSGDNNSPYLNWTGDNTSTGGIETTVVNLNQAYLDKMIAPAMSSSATIKAAAGWFQPSGGQGPATLTVSFKNKTTGELRGTTVLTIEPGQQDGLATTPVAVVSVSLSPDADPIASFSVSHA